MANTSPDNILTPDAGDQYALVQDLGVLADSVQDAFTRRANSFQGTAAARTAFTATATDGMLWQDTDGIKMIWRKDGVGWVPAVSKWAGTLAQMNSLTLAPNGFTWVDTATSNEYVKFNGVWSFGRIGFTLKGSTWDSGGNIFNGGTQATIEALGGTVGSRIIVPTIPGTWQFVLNGSWAENNSGLRLGSLAKNGISPVAADAAGNFAGVQLAASGRTEFSLTLTTPMNGTTDEMRFSVYQNSGTRLTLTWIAMTAVLLR